MPDYWYDHVHLSSPDPLRTAQFYESMFNAERVSTKALTDGRVTNVELHLGGSRILVKQGPAHLESAPPSSAATDGLEHFGIRTDNLDTAMADLKAKGVQFRDEIREIRPGVRLAFLWAPENVLVELLEVSTKP